MDKNIIELLIQCGAVGLCGLLIWLDWKKEKMFNKTLNNHLEHQYKSNIKLVSALKKLESTIRGCGHNKLNK